MKNFTFMFVLFLFIGFSSSVSAGDYETVYQCESIDFLIVDGESTFISGEPRFIGSIENYVEDVLTVTGCNENLIFEDLFFEKTSQTIYNTIGSIDGIFEGEEMEFKKTSYHTYYRDAFFKKSIFYFDNFRVRTSVYFFEDGTTPISGSGDISILNPVDLPEKWKILAELALPTEFCE